MTVAEIIALFDFDAWATGRTLESISALPGETYLRDASSSHGGIHGTLVHVLGASITWLARWRGSSPAAIPSVNEVPDLQTLRVRWEQYRADLSDLLASLTEEKLAAPLSYRDLKGNPQSEPLCQQMQHCVNHSSYHRGQVVTMLRQAGATPVGTDLITFYRGRLAR